MICDMHNDLLTADFDLNYVKKYIKLSQNTVVYALFTSKMSGNIFKNLTTIYNKIKSVLGANYLAIEDLHFITPEILERLNILPLLYCGLTWNNDNALGGGAFGDSDLTALGKKTIETLNTNNIIIDTAHLNEKTFYSVLENAECVINSHTALYDIKRHPRNIKKNQIKQIIKRGGIIGITPVKDFLGGSGEISDYIKHIDMFMQNFGADNICIGTDFYGTTPLDSLNNYESFDIIDIGLKKLGYAPIVTEKLFHLNAENFLKNRRR